MKNRILPIALAICGLTMASGARASAVTYAEIKNFSDACAWVTVDVKGIKWVNEKAKVVPQMTKWTTHLNTSNDAKIRIQMWEPPHCGKGPWVRDMYEAWHNDSTRNMYAIRKISGHYQMVPDTTVHPTLPDAR